MEQQNIKVRIIETNQLIEFKHSIIKFSDFLRQLEHDIDGQLRLSSTVVDPDSIIFIKAFFQAHQYDTSTIVVKKNRVRMNQSRIDKVSLGLFQSISEDDKKMMSLIKASDFFRIDILKSIILSIWATGKFDLPIEKDRLNNCFGHMSQGEEKRDLKKDYKQFFEMLSDKIYQYAVLDKKQ